jgi:hypothetical protein
VNSRGCQPTEHVPEIFRDPERVEPIVVRGMVRPLRGRDVNEPVTVGWYPRLFMFRPFGADALRLAEPRSAEAAKGTRGARSAAGASGWVGIIFIRV